MRVKCLIAALAVAVSALPAYAETVRVRVAADYDSLDPARMASTESWNPMVTLAYERLVTMTMDGQIHPALATSWEASPMGMVAKIRTGATCADGTVLTPTMVADSLRRIGLKETGAPFLVRIFGGPDYEVTGDDAAGTVTIKLKEPFNELLMGVSQPASAIVCPAGLKDTAALANDTFGTGEYQLDHAQSLKGDHYTLVKRDNYSVPGIERPGKKPTAVTFRVIANATTTANELLSNSIDVGLVNGRDQDRLRETAGIKNFPSPPWGMQYINFQHKEGHATADKAVREAVALTIDRAALARAGAFTYGIPATSPIGPEAACYDPTTADRLPQPDMAKARAVLEAAGWKLNASNIYEKDGKPLVLRVFGAPSVAGSAPEYVFQQVKALGADASLKTMNVREYLAFQFTDEWDVDMRGFSSGINSPNAISGHVSGQHSANINNPDFIKWRAAALSVPLDSKERCENWNKALGAMVEEFSIFPGFGVPSTFYYRDGLSIDKIAPAVLDASAIRILD